MRQLTTIDGLSDMVVNTIYRDPSGYVWMGTDISLDRFDGIRVKRYQVPVSIKHPRRVLAITSTRSGRIYAGNREGLYTIDPATDKLVKVHDKNLTAGVNALASVGDTVLAATEQGLYLLDTADDKLKLVTPDTRAFSDVNKVTGIALSDTDPTKAWLTSVGNVHLLDLAKLTLSTYPYCGDNQARLTQPVAFGGHLYMASRSAGLLKFDSERLEFDHLPQGGSTIITSLSIGADSLLYVGTDGSGILVLDPRNGDRLISAIRHGVEQPGLPSLRSNSVYSVLSDCDGLLWVGYYQSGLEYTLYQRDLFEVYRSDGLFDSNNHTVRALAVKGPGEMLIGTRDGLYYVNENTGTVSKHLPHTMIFAITPYRDKYIVGTYAAGLHVFDPATLTLTSFKSDSSGGDPSDRLTVFALAVDGTDRLWVGSDRGVIRYNGRQCEQHFTTANSQLPDDNVYEIFFDSSFNGWIATENGLALYSGGRMRTDRFPDQMDWHDKFRSIYQDADGRLYFMPDRGLITRTDKSLGHIEKISAPNSNSMFTPTFLTEDSDRGIWIGTSDGLVRLDTLGNFRHFSYPDGLPDQSFTLCKPIIDPDGNLWMGNLDGLLLLRADKLKAITTDNRKVVITGLEVDGTELTTAELSKPLIFNNNHNNLTIKFSDFSYTSPPYMRFEYTLVAADGTPEWKTLEGQTEIRFYNLVGGRYRFGVRRTGEPYSEAWLDFRVSKGLRNSPLWIVASWLGLLVIIVLAVALASRVRRHRKATAALASAGLSEDGTPVEGSEPQPTPEEAKYRTTRLSDEECRRLLKLLTKVMKEQRPFTNPDLKIGDLAALIGTSAHSLSYIFNQHLKSNYYDYVNAYRVEMFKQLVADGADSRYTLSAMGEKCGFSSRASFFRFFKKMAGMSPGEYLKAYCQKSK